VLANLAGRERRARISGRVGGSFEMIRRRTSGLSKHGFDASTSDARQLRRVRMLLNRAAPRKRVSLLRRPDGCSLAGLFRGD
jgi:hypothetical protein